eukprot:Rhum_TRINITY_DN14687_c4_g1::Rhum_TRINITY_DN14687_c4_g1_i2::g.107841::m.107841
MAMAKLLAADLMRATARRTGNGRVFDASVELTAVVSATADVVAAGLFRATSDAALNLLLVRLVGEACCAHELVAGPAALRLRAHLRPRHDVVGHRRIRRGHRCACFGHVAVAQVARRDGDCAVGCAVARVVAPRPAVGLPGTLGLALLRRALAVGGARAAHVAARRVALRGHGDGGSHVRAVLRRVAPEVPVRHAPAGVRLEHARNAAAHVGRDADVGAAAAEGRGRRLVEVDQHLDHDLLRVAQLRIHAADLRAFVVRRAAAASGGARRRCVAVQPAAAVFGAPPCGERQLVSGADGCGVRRGRSGGKKGGSPDAVHGYLDPTMKYRYCSFYN